MRLTKRSLIFTLFIFLLTFAVFSVPENKKSYLTNLAPGGSKMIFIPDGNYFIGDNDSIDNSPLRKRPFSGFFIDIHPVTNFQFMQFLEKKKYQPEGTFDKNYAGQKPHHPVTGITLRDASAYAAYAGKRLPSEWEWEIAARALKKDYFSDLATIYKNKKGIFFKMERKEISQVFSTPPNDIGFYDFIGNIFEWTTGEYPREFLTGKYKNRLKLGVIRGGAWTNIRNDVKFSTRTPFPIKRSLPWIGFRCVKDLKH